MLSVIASLVVIACSVPLADFIGAPPPAAAAFLGDLKGHEAHVSQLLENFDKAIVIVPNEDAWAASEDRSEQAALTALVRGVIPGVSSFEAGDVVESASGGVLIATDATRMCPAHLTSSLGVEPEESECFKVSPVDLEADDVTLFVSSRVLPEM